VMMPQSKHLVYLAAFLLIVIILFPFPAQAQNFSVSPMEIKIDNLSPGGDARFNLTIRNKEDVNHVFALTTYNPGESERREGRTEFPDDSWISFSSQKVSIEANSEAKTKVTVAIPANQKWAGKDWEIWLRVMPEEQEFLVVNYYIRLLVSTGGEVEAGMNVGVVVGIIVGILLVACVVYYFRRKAKPKHLIS
jgi:hypothetical protein